MKLDPPSHHQRPDFQNMGGDHLKNQDVKVSHYFRSCWGRKVFIIATLATGNLQGLMVVCVVEMEMPNFCPEEFREHEEFCIAVSIILDWLIVKRAKSLGVYFGMN